MYLRSLRQRTGITKTVRGFRTNACSRRAFLSTAAPRLEQQRDASASAEQNGQRDGQQQQTKTTSIRPFTILALLVPLGYALSWATDGKNGRAASTSADGFVKYTLVRKEDVSSTSSIFTLKPATSKELSTDEPGLERAIKSVQFKQPQLQIARNYTLLSHESNQDTELRFLIRKERRGEMSGYLHRLPIDSEVELRGPVVDYVLPEGVDEVIFLAGGTGVAPALQVAAAYVGQVRTHLLWANRSRQDCIGGTSDTAVQRSWISWLTAGFLASHAATLKERDDGGEKSSIVSTLEAFKHVPADAPTTSESTKLLVDYFVDEEGTFMRPDHVRRLLQSTSADRTAGKKLLLISGPEGFINYWAGPKQWVNGREVQGPVGGVLSSLNLTGWEVVKL